MSATESRRDLNRVMDWTRSLGLGLLMVWSCLEGEWDSWISPEGMGGQGWISGLFDRFRTASGGGPPYFLHLALVLGLISVLGQPGRREPGRRWWIWIFPFLAGIVIFYAPWSDWVPGGAGLIRAGGYLLLLTAGWRASRRARGARRVEDPFNRDQQGFPQEERRRSNPYSLHFPARYFFRGRWKSSWINLINPFRGVLILGSPGSGKSYYLIREIIRQHIRQGFTLFVYDFKYDDLTRVAHHYWKKYRSSDSHPPSFFQLHFDDLSRSHRCNPLDPGSLMEISDAADSARTLLLGLNRLWIRKQGDFFVESSIQLLTAALWYLKSQARGRYCTLPHLLELIQQPYATLFTLLRCQEDLQPLVNPFVQAYQSGAVDQLEGQVASLRIALSRLHSPRLYYLLSGDDFQLDINNPENPKIVCLGNMPVKAQIYGAVHSLIIGRLVKLVNQKGRLPSCLIFDELPTVYVHGLDTLMATARSNKVATCLAAQDLSQLIRDYGREQAQVILQISGNLLCGQVSGETARGISERIGRILQARVGHSVHDSGMSWSQSQQLESAVPVSTLSQLSSGEFVGLVSDNPDQLLENKVFHARIRNSRRRRREEDESPYSYAHNPDFREEEVGRCYQQIKDEIRYWVARESERIEETPEYQHLIVRPPRRRQRSEGEEDRS